jgi:membrane protease YdiL (CAAX protease family)
MKQSRPIRPDAGLIIALVVGLVLQPALYCLIRPKLLFGADVGTTGRAYWWLISGWVLLWAWLPFGVLFCAVQSGRHKWQDVAGVDWYFFSRHRTICVAMLTIFVIGTAIAPALFYHGNPPRISPHSIYQPVSWAERIMFLVVAMSAGVCEEVTYRGLPLRLLASSSGRAWIVLPVTMVAFMFHHGPVGHMAFVYLLLGFVFGSTFILLGRRRLEWLIILHAIYDAIFAVLP